VDFQGEIIFQALLKAGTDRKIAIKIAQNAPTQDNPNVDTEVLVKRKAAQVRSLNFAKLLGGGVLHTKFWIVDRKHVYLGSANMDWRSLTQVKIIKQQQKKQHRIIFLENCSCTIWKIVVLVGCGEMSRFDNDRRKSVGTIRCTTDGRVQYTTTLMTRARLPSQ
jgi:hypothetical protein